MQDRGQASTPCWLHDASFFKCHRSPHAARHRNCWAVFRTTAGRVDKTFSDSERASRELLTPVVTWITTRSLARPYVSLAHVSTTLNISASAGFRAFVRIAKHFLQVVLSQQDFYQVISIRQTDVSEHTPIRIYSLKVPTFSNASAYATVRWWPCQIEISKQIPQGVWTPRPSLSPRVLAAIVTTRRQRPAPRCHHTTALPPPQFPAAGAYYSVRMYQERFPVFSGTQWIHSRGFPICWGAHQGLLSRYQIFPGTPWVDLGRYAARYAMRWSW